MYISRSSKTLSSCHSCILFKVYKFSIKIRYLLHYLNHTYKIYFRFILQYYLPLVNRMLSKCLVDRYFIDILEEHTRSNCLELNWLRFETRKTIIVLFYMYQIAHVSIKGAIFLNIYLYLIYSTFKFINVKHYFNRPCVLQIIYTHILLYVVLNLGL